LFVDFTKLTPASKAEKAISQLLGTLTCESLTEDLMGPSKDIQYDCQGSISET
jgi:hypothetical protein